MGMFDRRQRFVTLIAAGRVIRVIRGGGWRYDARFARSAGRDRCGSDNRYNDLGFRPALSSVR